ncbi:MAG TPA: PRTRC system protein D [Burkholderiaceae bacterium]|nr:PRTRC system protein D [Burkholderiaceae bacterium]
MDDSLRLTVRAVDVGYGFTKFVRELRESEPVCQHFPSMAAAAGRRALAEGLGQRRDTVTVAVDGIDYEVGPDVALAVGRFREETFHDDFAESPTYLALVRGALAYIGQPTIDLLVVGLPVSTFIARREALRARLIGSHDCGGRAVEVRDVLVLAQPHGALGAWGLTKSRFYETKRRTTMVVDCGYRTFDWIVARGFRVMDALSGAVNRGMRDALLAIAEPLSSQLGLPVRSLERLDVALRTGQPALLAGREIDLAGHVAQAHKVAEEAVASLKAAVEEAAAEIDLILLVGGSAWFFAPHLQRAFPKHRIERVQDSMSANVRGYQLYGMEIAASRQRALRAMEAA